MPPNPTELNIGDWSRHNAQVQCLGFNPFFLLHPGRYSEPVERGYFCFQLISLLPSSMVWEHVMVQPDGNLFLRGSMLRGCPRTTG